MSDEFDFDPPAASIGIRWADYEGRLLLFDVHAVEASISTGFGERTAVRAYVQVIDGDTAGEGYADTLVFPKVLQSQLRTSVGRKVLGRLGRGEAKSGQNAPWKLADPTDEDKKLAREYLAKVAIPDKPPF